MSIPPPGYNTPQASPPPPPPPAPEEAPLSREDAEARTESRQSGDTLQYEFKSVQALRGRASSARAKWQDHGWEFVSENRGTLRTELNFRRIKPKGASLLSFVATFRRLKPKKQLALVASGGLILVACTIGIAVGTTQGDNTRYPRAAQPTTSAPPHHEQILTAENSKELAALLKVPGNCDRAIAPFVAKYGGRTIAFDGSIVNVAHHGDYDTRYDILVSPGNKGAGSSVGPSFQFEDVNIFDLHLTGTNGSGSVGVGDRFRFVAQVVKYNPTQCLLSLAPVSSKIR